MKKIFFISRDANWQLYRNEVLSYLAMANNIDIEILTTGTLKPYLKESKNLKYKIFKNIFKNNKKINFFPRAIKYIYDNRPDCVVGQNGALNLTEYFSLILCKIIGVKFVWWTRGYEHKPVKNKFLKNIRQLYVNYFLKLADSIIVYSQIGFNFLIEIGCSKDKIHLALNTLDTHRLKAIRRSLQKEFTKEEFIKKQFITASSNSKFILFSGRINKYKKVKNLIFAMELILKVEKDIHLIIIGDGDEKTDCEKISDKLGINKNVHFMGPIYDENIVNKYFEVADIFCIPGSVGLGIVHAFSFGLPLVTENIDYHSAEIQYLKDGYNGLLVDEDNVLQLANTLLENLSDPSLLSELSKNALNTIDSEANIDNMIASYSKAIFQ